MQSGFKDASVDVAAREIKLRDSIYKQVEQKKYWETVERGCEKLLLIIRLF